MGDILPPQFRGDVQAAIEAVTGLQTKVEQLDAVARFGKVSFVAMPSGVKLQSLKPLFDEWLMVPERMKGTTTLFELESLAAYINRHKRDESVVFIDDSDPLKPSITVVFDAHEPESVRLQAAEGADGQEPSPGWQEFRAAYSFPMTPEWEAWHGTADKWLSQTAFAEFLEQRIDEVLDPSEAGEAATKMAERLGFALGTPTKLLEVSRGLQLRVNQNVVNAQNLSTGEIQVLFEEKHEAAGGGPPKVPGGFAIIVPVFRGGALYRIPVRVRYRTESGRIMWQLLPHRLDRVFANAIEGAAEDLRAKTAVPVLRGKPARGGI